MMTTETIIYENDNYTVVETNDALGEDGKYGHEGYALVSKRNGFIEATNMMRANIIFLADQANGMLLSLEQEDEDEGLIGEFMEDSAPVEH